MAMLLLFLTAPLAQAAPPTGGESASISQSETWTDDATMDGHISIANGATLTINANITMETGSSITVEEGGQLVLTNGGLYSNDLYAGVMVNSVLASLTLNFGDVADDGVLQLKFDHEIPDGVKMNVKYGDTTVNASGLDIVQFDVPLNDTNLTITFDAYYFTPTYILWAKAIHSGGDTVTIMAQDITATNAPLYWFQSSFDLIAHGDMSITSFEIEGANITCHRLCQFENAQLTGSAPIHAATTASLSLKDSTIAGSRTDEDIVLHDQASITYTNSQGTGGTTDAWIRLLSERSLTTNIPNGSLDLSGIGWGASNWNDLTDENGYILLVPAGQTNEHKRIVEWMDGQGVVHQEEATITLSVSSSWGIFSTTIDAPMTSNGSIELALPYVQVTAVEPESSTGVANKSVSGMVSVTNSGTVAVSSVSIWCYEGTEVADTTQLTVSLNAGETKQVAFTWYAYEAGDATLTCKPLLPNALNELAYEVMEADGATSQTVTWTYAEEVKDAPILIWMAAGLGSVGLALFARAQVQKQRYVESENQTNELLAAEDEEKSYADEF
jgi:hypothetical protein